MFVEAEAAKTHAQDMEGGESMIMIDLTNYGVVLSHLASCWEEAAQIRTRLSELLTNPLGFELLIPDCPFSGGLLADDGGDHDVVDPNGGADEAVMKKTPEEEENFPDEALIGTNEASSFLELGAGVDMLGGSTATTGGGFRGPMDRAAAMGVCAEMRADLLAALAREGPEANVERLREEVLSLVNQRFDRLEEMLMNGL